MKLIRWTAQELGYAERRNEDRQNSDPNYLQSIYYLPPVKICRFLGNALQQARENQGLSISQINAKTCISNRYIEAIEAGYFELLPSGLLLRSFIKVYASCINLDKDIVMQVFLGEIPIQSDIDEANPYREVNDVPIENTAHPPPKFAEYLLYFLLTKSERVNLIGDLTEEYGQVLSKFGIKKANYWYFKQVFDSLWPLIKRLIQKTGFYTGVAEIIRRFMN